MRARSISNMYLPGGSAFWVAPREVAVGGLSALSYKAQLSGAKRQHFGMLFQDSARRPNDVTAVKFQRRSHRFNSGIGICEADIEAPIWVFAAMRGDIDDPTPGTRGEACFFGHARNHGAAQHPSLLRKRPQRGAGAF